MDSAVAAWDEVRHRVAAAAARAGRDPAGITIVAVSKEASRPALEAVYAAGVRDFGENRASGLIDHAAWVPDDARWHFIGRLQGNKVRLVLPLVRLLHSLDRLELAAYWAGPGLPAPPVLVQVNVAADPAKAGSGIAEAPTLVAAAEAAGLVVRGLMTIAPAADDPEAGRPHFAALRSLRDRLQVAHPTLIELSMGMSDDFEVAVEEGATILRVGRAIFRSYPEEG